MILTKILEYRRKRNAKANVKANSTMVGNNHVLGPSSHIYLQDGATKDSVVLEDQVWMLGTIMVQNNGKVIMHELSKIDDTTSILCVDRVEIGAYTAIAKDTVICDNNNHPISPAFRRKMRPTPVGDDMRMWKHSAHAPIIIGENVWIGSCVRICKGVTIGDNAVIAANSVVTKNVPANCIAAGNPAKIVKTDIDQIDK